MKIIVFTDTHANLPAVLAFRKVIEAEGYDLAVHTGDAIDIGPYPAETLDALLSIPRSSFIMGNHDAIFVHGMPDPLPSIMKEREAVHCRWTAEQLSDGYRNELEKWPYYIQHEFNGVGVTFVHYGLSPGLNDFVSVMRDDPGPDELDSIFAQFHTELLFYGHSHPFSDVQGKTRYINPGALGCFYRPLARYCVLEFQRGGYRISYEAVPYDDSELQKDYDRRKVPCKNFILNEFFGKNV